MAKLGKGGPPEQIPETADYIDISQGDIENTDRQKIGAGASSIVYRVELKDQLQTNIAVKYPDFSGTAGQAQFEAIIEEAKVWTELTNSDDDYAQNDGLSGQDHIVDVIDWGQGTGSIPWIALEYMDRGSLQELLDERTTPLPVDKALWISLCVCRGVRHAHRFGVRHHDIKPSNILLRKTAAGWNLPKITDWGVAKVMIEEDHESKGFTPAYAAPEQFQREEYRNPDETTDIYQIGILAYRLLTGELPFDGAAPEIKKAKLSGDFVPVGEHRDLPDEFDQLISKAISKSPSSRFESVVYLRDEIKALFDEYREKTARENAFDDLQLDSTEDLVNHPDSDTIDDAQADDQATATAKGITDWESYREHLDEREAHPIYSISPHFIRNLLYPDLTAEVERAQEERQQVENEFSTIRSEAREVRSFLEDQMYDAAIINDSLEEEVDDRLNTVRDITDDCDHLLSEKEKYLKNTEQKRLNKIQNELAGFYRYLTEKKKLNKALETLRDRLAVVSDEISETLPDNELLPETEEQRLLDELDKVSAGIRHSKIELSMEVLEETDTQAFEKLLADERKLRKQVEEHNQKIVQEIYRHVNKVATEHLEETNGSIKKYQQVDISVERARARIDTVESGVAHIENFLESRKGEYITPEQRETFEQHISDLQSNSDVFRAKIKFDEYHDQIHSKISSFKSSVDELLDMETYLPNDQQTELDSQVEGIHNHISSVYQDKLLQHLNENDIERFHAAKIEMANLDRKVSCYNSKFVRKNYHEINKSVDKTIKSTNQSIDKYYDTSQAGISMEDARTHIDSIETGVSHIDNFLESPKSELITPEQQETFEQQLSELQFNLDVFENIVEFEDYHDQIQTKMSSLKSSIDELLDMETYLSDDQQSELNTQLQAAHDDIHAIYNDDLIQHLNEKDTERLHTSEIELARIDRQICEYNPKLVQQNYPEIEQEAAETLEETDNVIDTYYDTDQTIKIPYSSYLEILKEQQNRILDVLETWKVEHISQDQKQTLEELLNNIRSNISLFTDKKGFDTKIEAVDEYITELETTTDELLDMESYLSEGDRSELDGLVTKAHAEFDHIDDNNLTKQLNSEDTQRLHNARVALGLLDRRIQEYNEVLVNKRYSKKVSETESVITSANKTLKTCKQRGERLPTDVEALEQDLDTTAATLDQFQNIKQFSLLSKSQREIVFQLLGEVESDLEYITTKHEYDDYMMAIESKFAKLQSLYDDHLGFESYLTVDTKETLHEKIDVVREAVAALEQQDLLDRLSTGDRRRLRGYELTLDRYFAHVNSYNERFIKHESDEYGQLFEDLTEDNISLNQRQESAVFTNEQHNRIIAGPGTGKTFSLVCRIRYLIAKEVDEQDILALAFNNKAEDEISDRLRDLFGIDQVHVRSLNSFGYSIINSSHPDWFVLVGESRLREIERIIQQMCDENDDFNQRYFELYQKYRKAEYDEKQDVEDNMYEQIKYSGDTTFASESFENKFSTERKALRDIANTLFKHGIDYDYSRYADWAKQSVEDGYTPDFTLTEHNICIEYIPPTSVRNRKKPYERKPSDSALDRIYADTEYDLITIHGEDISRDTISKILRYKLNQSGVSTENPLLEHELKTQVFDQAVERELIEKIGNFIEHTKTNQLDPAEKLEALDADEGSLLHRFTSIATLVYNKYKTLFDEYGAFDYKDMEVMAKNMLESGEDDLSLDYDHVLVDEFQDLNLAQIQLVQQILDRSGGARLFAVGDDWQSIYGFKGARPEYFVNFEDHFSPATTTRLSTNYRCPASVVDSSNELMEDLDVSTDKSLKAADFTADTKPTVNIVPGREGYQYKINLVSDIVDIIAESVKSKGRSPNDIMVLARNTLGSPYVPRIIDELDNRGIPVGDRDGVTVDTAHSSKGTESEHVIVLNAARGHADGFPPEEPESNLLEAVNETDDSQISEERRLFYVAITRTKRDLDVQTRYGYKSQFVTPLENHGQVDSIGFDADQSRTSITGKVKSPNNNQVGKQIGSLQTSGYRISYKITNDCSETDGFEENQRYELDNVKVGSYDDAPQFVIDQKTEITELS